ncbi:MAG TPA: hypothetical protein VK646_08345 [Actinomycetota bacterium]|nr:hypothetical protein [Actinomycetota bacterium]
MRRTLLIMGAIFAAFLIVRAIVEVITIHYAHPSSYEHDWGGPSLIGVLLVHCLPGVLAAIALVVVIRRSRSS